MSPLINGTIQITIVSGSSQQECDAGCGEDWSSAETITLAGQRVKDRFGEKIRLECIVLSEAITDRQALEWSQTIRNKNLSFPLLLINGEPRMSGQFDIRQLLDAVDAEIDIGVQY